MKTIGMIGGISWQSTAEYYRIINQTVAAKMGGSHSAKILLYSVNFREIEEHQRNGDWDLLAQQMVGIASNLERGGAECLVICANTMHKVADSVERAVGIPLLHIGDVTAEAIKQKEMSCVGLLGTRFTMGEPFYKERLAQKHGIRTLIPSEAAREFVHNTIHKELVTGHINPESKKRFLEIIENLASQGAEGVILGCTEIPLIVKAEDTDRTVFDTTYLHAKYAAEFALQDQ
jgi:aspartate racemase